MTTEQGFQVTEKIAVFVSEFEESKIPEEVYSHAKVALLDWIAVTMGGKDDPLVEKLIRYADRMGGNEQAKIIGHEMYKTVEQAAIINGSASHALDYDDTLVSFLGHPSVTLFPGLLALSEWKGFSGKDFLTAYIIGLQAGAAIGTCASLDHYMAGWHATATLGHLASSAACARLLGLDLAKTRYALGIGGTQSSGLKRVFGTMCKPFHAGMASQAGVMAALLAEDGFTSAEDVLEGPQGFFEALKGKVNEDAVNLLGLGWSVTDLSQKYHASCHATHSPLEAALAAVENNSLDISAIKEIRVFSSQMALSAAGKPSAKTGLEGKFSIPYCIANALVRRETGYRAFTDEKVNAPEIQDLMAKIRVTQDDQKLALEANVEVETENGEVYKEFSDILNQIPPLETKQERVKAKFFDLADPVVGNASAQKIYETIEKLETHSSMKTLTDLI